jgi:SAM-dependent methyltransferase
MIVNTRTGSEDESPSYGKVNKYLGAEGEAYFQRQSSAGLLAGKFNEFLYKPYVSEQDDVLEFGCGGGYLLHTLKAKTKVGVDINPAARARGAELGVQIYSTLDELKGRTFDKIITSHALEHVPNPYQALMELKSFLRPEGLLIWLSPLDDWRRKAQKQWQSDDPDMHLYTWTPLLLGNLLSAAGYKPLSVSLVTHAFPPLIVAKLMWGVNPRLFHLSAFVWASLRRQRQILAVATADNSATPR